MGGVWILHLMLLLYSIGGVAASMTEEVDALLDFKGFVEKDSDAKLRSWNARNKSNACRWGGVTCSRTNSSKHLQGINLGGFGLAGSLAPQLGNLMYLTTLNLSFNSFAGIIPAQLGYCTSLRVLDLSHNQLTGAIPSAGVFMHLNASSFEGNPGLCGPFIHKKCNIPNQEHHGIKKKTILAITLAPTVALIMLAILMSCYFLHRPSTQHVEEFATFARPEHFTAEELVRATQGYSQENLLGEGGSSRVYKGVLSDNRIVAVKKLKDAGFHKTFLREMQVLGKLRHKNLVRIVGCVLNLEVKALILEYMPHGSLENYLHHDGELIGWSWEMFMKIAVGVANGLAYLHHDYDVPIIHGDVKPSNILLDSEFEGCLGDFGIAKIANIATKLGGVSRPKAARKTELITNANTSGDSPSSNFKGSIGYMAPEYAYAAQISTKVDVYSYGVVILEMLTRTRPTQAPAQSLSHWVASKLPDRVEEVLEKSLFDEGSSTTSRLSNDNMVAVQLVRLALACMQDSPKDRPTMREVLVTLSNIRRGTSNFQNI